MNRDRVAHAKPDPGLFLAAAEARGVPIEHSIVVGDSIWALLTARRARAPGVRARENPGYLCDRKV
jgi:HAD superfamily hydrolase (TIGR01509 family)